MTFLEKTSDRNYAKKCHASDNNATYILTSAHAHDMVTDFEEKFERIPTARWYNNHFSFERVDK